MSTQVQEQEVVINAEGQILGRMASNIVRLLKEGKKVVIVNGEKAVISGEKNRVIESYKLLLTVRTLFNPYRNGIRRPKSPINIVKRTIRGMLPKSSKGRRMLKNVKVYIGVPKEFEGRQFIKFPDADVSRLKGKYVTVEVVAKELGWSG
ncbi:50S ribosomal protein L13 [Saccharolobus islandicus]|jgi:large subunit ribosomal protein L13|uniref:Large ribosomal subunit protein uL13 n=6 Tax=Saccharolobus islandicus TaxID=43080 RepID=M9UB82_SACIS|nr:50S ribosomal protein L13 [Sulfolobus islandicus]ACP38791.1 ribosomal protein L13 [Sulfolobus islandicus M.14.25]ACP55996.1 ribosomal protein L13 [Sulfolobus islandicus M.16.27]ACR42659.1 ribosomal protein L13 [Sulfolobus islandicus M.16.4]ADX83342.1 ribosomal protein L13 [Sulfolobus islandicus HVE10/4]ADX85985.1 ribosomal protein L13 [Sulfolobus islandicus REY15A]